MSRVQSFGTGEIVIASLVLAWAVVRQVQARALVTRTVMVVPSALTVLACWRAT